MSIIYSMLGLLWFILLNICSAKNYEMPFLLERLSLVTRKVLYCLFLKTKEINNIDSVEMDNNNNELFMENENINNKNDISKSAVNKQDTIGINNNCKPNVSCVDENKSINSKEKIKMNVLALNYLAFIFLFLFSFTFNVVLWFRICFNL
jgi:hypothetical protein